MDVVLTLLKLRLGISSDVMVDRLNQIIDAVIHELKDEKGINVDLDNPRIIGFVVEYAAWRYEKKTESAGLPRHLQMDLRNLYLHNRRQDV
jgi:transcriptional regulator